MEAEVPNKCNLCGSVFRDDNNLKRHQKRKTPCVVQAVPGGNVNDPNRCIYCNKVLSKKSHLVRHHKTCKMKNGGIQNLPAPVQIDERLRILEEEQRKRDEEKEREKEERRKRDEEKDRELAELRAMIKEMMSRPAVVNVNNGPINTGPVTNNITINTYDNPNYQHLMDKAVSAKVRSVIEKHLMAFPLELIVPLWFSTNHPENHSVIVDPKKPSVCRVLGEHGWELRDTAESANEMRLAASDVAKKLVREHAPDIFGLAGGIEDRKYAVGAGTQQDNAAIMRKMVLGSQLITGAITGVK